MHVGTALVTGASSGIGEATARRLLAGGWTVYAAARRIERMADLENAGARLIQLDLTRDSSIQAAVERIRSEAGGVTALINNAGYGSYGAVEDVPVDEARRQFDVNLFGAARLTQLLLATMRENGQGRIVNVSSVGGQDP
jgi:NAD(P)-dependent dehydrogenase (short-subunit alcohol dehydrogenase family)